MKTDVTIVKEGKTVKIGGGVFPESRYTEKDYGVQSPYLSWENASYIFTRPNEEEKDDYLLNHALQDGRKLCVSFHTCCPEKIVENFNDNDNYNIFVKKNTNSNDSLWSTVFVVRKGTLGEYFDMEVIENIYNQEGFLTGKLSALRNTPMISFINGTCTWDNVRFNPILNMEAFESDEVLQTFGPSALMISGLIFGYPIETTVHELKRIFGFLI